MFSTVAETVKTIEKDKQAIDIAKANFEKYNVKNIEIFDGNALETLKEIDQTFDLIFIDAMKREYKSYLLFALKLITSEGFIFADNTISHKDKMKDFFDYLENSNLNWKELNIGKGLVEIKHCS